MNKISAIYQFIDM